MDDQHEFLMKFILLSVLTLVATALFVQGQTPRPVDATPVSTTVPLLPIKLGFDAGAPRGGHYFAIRPEVPPQSPLFPNLGWTILRNDRLELDANAKNLVSIRIPASQPGRYKVFLRAYVNERYERISNLIEFDVDADLKGRPKAPPGAIPVKPGDSILGKYASLPAKDLLKLSIEKLTERDFIITRPSLPPGVNWGDLSWVMTLDGRELSSVGAPEMVYKPFLTEKGTYEVHLQARIGKRVTDVSERIKFRVLR